jgi:hypothetical protein
MAATAAILDLASVDYRTNAWVDWSDFSAAYWGWQQEGYFRWSAPPLIQDGRYGRQLEFGFRRFSDQRLRWLLRRFGGSLGVTGGRFLSMSSSATHPRWPLRLPFWIWLPLIFSPTPGSTRLIFWWLIAGNWRKIPFDDQRRRLSNMAATTANLGFGSRRLSDERLRRMVRFFWWLIGGHQSSPCSTSP